MKTIVYRGTSLDGFIARKDGEGIHLPTLLCFLILQGILTGCGYTIIRDFDEEARQAEWAALDTLTSAPDLIITDVEYEYFPPSETGFLDHGYLPARVQFFLTVKNIGDDDFTKSYCIVFSSLDPPSSIRNPARGLLQNRKGKRILPDSSQEIEIWINQPLESSVYSFTLVTNAVIQRKVIVDLGPYVDAVPDPPRSREFRYDNNEATVTISGLRDFLGTHPR